MLKRPILWAVTLTAPAPPQATQCSSRISSGSCQKTLWGKQMYGQLLYEYYFNTGRERKLYQKTKQKFTDEIELIRTWPFPHFGPKRREKGRKTSMFKELFLLLSRKTFHLLCREKFHKDTGTSGMPTLVHEHSNNRNINHKMPTSCDLTYAALST